MLADTSISSIWGTFGPFWMLVTVDNESCSFHVVSILKNDEQCVRSRSSVSLLGVIYLIYGSSMHESITTLGLGTSFMVPWHVSFLTAGISEASEASC